MSSEKESVDRTIVPCAGCRNEAPLSGANIAEVVNYIIDLCGGALCKVDGAAEGSRLLAEPGTRKR
jgi:hypothetical protein